MKDYYVGAMKAVMLGISPKANLVDISHEIPPFDVMAGAWVIKNSAFLFPKETIHLVVVDSGGGDGEDKKPVALKIDGHYFVGPDNGLFSLLAETRDFQAHALTNTEYWHQEPASRTFNGRDIFASVAAHLQNGVELKELGPQKENLKNYRWALPITHSDGLQGWILHIDRFGNLITNIPEESVEELSRHKKVKIYVGNTILRSLDHTFADVPESEPVAYIGSSGMLEVAVNNGNAAELLGISKGASISVIWQ